MASLDVRSPAPTDEQARELALEHNVRDRGEVVELVVADSPAESAGIEPGDACSSGQFFR